MGQRSEQTLRLNIHVHKVIRTHWCLLGAHQVQMKNLAGKFLCNCRLLRTLLSPFSSSSVFSIVLIWCMFSET